MQRVFDSCIDLTCFKYFFIENQMENQRKKNLLKILFPFMFVVFWQKLHSIVVTKIMCSSSFHYYKSDKFYFTHALWSSCVTTIFVHNLCHDNFICANTLVDSTFIEVVERKIFSLDICALYTIQSIRPFDSLRKYW